jgi:cytochrome b6-f complex iron-sulfur subunit
LAALWTLTWGCLVAAAGLAVGAVLRLAGAGRTSAQAPVVLGPASELAQGQVATRAGVAVGRDAAGVYALDLTCPHLGCRVEWVPEAGRFRCPCHGSAFGPKGSLLQGPAGRGLAHLALRVDGRGRLVATPGRTAPASSRLKG